MNPTLSAMNNRALAEIKTVVDRISSETIVGCVDMIVRSHRIAVFGVGREGLMMRAFCMRLFHLGLDAHVVGDMTTPPLGPGDLLIVSAGPGHFSTVQALIETSKRAGAETLCFTAEPKGLCPNSADAQLVLPAQTMARDEVAPTSSLPMGSLYEGVLFLVAEYLVLMLRDRLEITSEVMRSRHTNLE